MKEYRMSFTSDHLIDQIIDGRKTASVEWLDKQGELNEWDRALKTGRVYTVCDSNRIPKCKIRVVEMELSDQRKEQEFDKFSNFFKQFIQSYFSAWPEAKVILEDVPMFMTYSVNARIMA